jgi:hypothetical protein
MKDNSVTAREFTQDPPDLVEMVLTETQHREFLPLVRQQATSRRGLLLCSVGPFFDQGTTKLRLQAQFVTQAAASKILKIIQNEHTNKNSV